MTQTTVRQNNSSDLLKSLLPSGIASVCLHGLTIVITVLCLRGCDRGMPSEDGGEVFRTVGLAQVDDIGSDIETGDHSIEAAVQPPQDGIIEAPSEATHLVPDTPPSIDNLLHPSGPTDATTDSEPLDLIGAGATLAGLTPPDAAPPLIRSGKSDAGGGALDGGPADTIFMDIADSGETFVYLIDTSGSMGDGGRMGLAKKQLKSSIKMLKSHQRFQVVFYSETASQLKLGKQARDIYPANVVNIQKAISKIEMVQPNYGTKYIPALKRALELQPDVLYFLTDGVGVESNVNVDELLRLNTSGARIHVVEFASADRQSRDPSWLEKLASRTQGQYRRIVVTGRRR